MLWIVILLLILCQGKRDKTGQSANSYIKGLIKHGLDSKGFVMESGCEESDMPL